MGNPCRVIEWHQLHWQRPLDITAVCACLRQWAADQRSPRLILEVRATGGNVFYLLGAERRALSAVTRPLKELLGTTLSKPAGDRTQIQAAGRLHLSTRHRSLRAEEPELLVRSVLAALTRARKSEELVLQLVLGPRRIPLSVPATSPSSLTAPWWQTAWRGDGSALDGETRSALRQKVADHGFAATVRLGATAVDAPRRRSLLLGLTAALRTAESPGLQLSLRPESPRRLNGIRSPWLWPLRLAVPEVLPFAAWPLGDNDLPGQPAPHPRVLPPVPGITGSARVLAAATGAASDKQLSLSVQGALQHLHVLAPTGAGKSTLLAQLIVQDIAAGRAVVVIEPRGDLVESVLARVPADQHDRIVVLDPNDDQPVGLNPLLLHGRRPELVADNVLTLFRQLYGKAIGPRSTDILYAGLLSLAKHDNASLAMLPLLLTNTGFRRSITRSLSDPFSLDSFWATYESWSDAERATAIAPVMNKLRPLLRPGLRGVIGQRNPRFSLSQVFSERKVLLVPLQRGVIGEDAASLLGSLLVSELWQLIQGRGAIAPEKRHPVLVYIDEVQDYLHTGVNLADALAQSRGYGAGFILAHQLMEQLPNKMRAAVLGNVRSRITFALPPKDARTFSEGHPEISPADLTALGAYEVYVSLINQGRPSPYASGRTLPLTPPTTDSAQLRARSREQWGQPLDSIERDLAQLIQADQPDSDLGPTGRRRRPS